MATIHFLQQGKGGVGKSVVAAMLVQALKKLGQEVVAFDTDPVNASLASYDDFKAVRIDIVRNGVVDSSIFDDLMEGIFALPPGAHAVVDNGASSFLALNTYLKEIKLLDVLAAHGDEIYFHSVVMGGGSLNHCLSGLAALANGFPEAPIIVWLNPHEAPVSVNGLSFEEFKVYQENVAHFQAVLQIPAANKDTLGKDLRELFGNSITFAHALADPNTRLATRLRLQGFWDEIVRMVEQAHIAG
jgi:hypothetical protein